MEGREEGVGEGVGMQVMCTMFVTHYVFHEVLKGPQVQLWTAVVVQLCDSLPQPVQCDTNLCVACTHQYHSINKEFLDLQPECVGQHYFSGHCRKRRK